MKEKVLVINAGSSSLKFSVYEMPEEKLIANGLVERIGSKEATWKLSKDSSKFNGCRAILNHTEAFNLMKEELIKNEIVKDLNEISGIGHRVLHGGEIYKDSVLIDENVKMNIKILTDLGPLHHPGQLAGIKSAEECFPNVPMVSVFDTAFHQTMEEKEYLYPIPYELYQKNQVRKYGFHGTSCKYITEAMKERLGRFDINIIICHIGSGASITAVKNGVSYSTTMGLTPNAGLMMGTRSGTIEPAVLEYLSKVNNTSLSDLNDLLNKKSGMLGVSGFSNDYRDIEKYALIEYSDTNSIELNEKIKRAKLALEMFVDSAVKYILEFAVKLDGKVDAIIFTAGVGENACNYRKMVIDKCKTIMPILINDSENEKIASFKEVHEGIITTSESKIPVYVIPTNEELIIARDTYNLSKEKTFSKTR